MKKLLVVASIALAFAANSAMAQDQAGGAGASVATIGGVAVDKVVAAGVAVAVAAAIVSNNSGTTLPIIPPPPPPPQPGCTGSDPLVNGACVGTTTTVTVTGTGTTTATVPVTFTYAPTLQ